MKEEMEKTKDSSSALYEKAELAHLYNPQHALVYAINRA